MKHSVKLLLILTFISISTGISAQSYTTELSKGIEYYNQGKNYDAYLRFNGAKTFAEVGKNSKRIKEAQKWIEKSVIGIQGEKTKSDSLLELAKVMQEKMESAIFDKAVKAKIPEWKGYKNYESIFDVDFKEIISRIDELDLSDNGLMRIPSQVAECTKLKRINLFGNPDLDLKSLFQLVEKLDSKVGLSISINDIDRIPKKYYKNISGIQFLKLHDSIPSELYALSNLEYIDLGEFKTDSLPLPFFKYKNLKFISLYGNAEISNIISFLNSYDKNIYIKTSINPVNVNSLPALDSTFLYVVLNSNLFISLDIKQIKKLKSIDLSNEEWDGFPNNLTDLSSLTILNLSNNLFNEIPDKIGELNNLEILRLNQNNINYLPESIKKLSKLKLIDIRNTGIQLKERQKIQQWLPECIIEW